MTGVAAGPDPTVHRRRLRNELRKARESAGRTQRDVAAAMDWSQSKLIRIETGAVNISTNDLRALLAHYDIDPARINTLVDLRMQRQEIITRDPAPELHFIMDEAVIRRVVGGLSVARRQLRHLLEMNQQDNVTMRVVSFSRGIYSKLRVPYVLFEFPESEDEDVLYLENPTGEFLIRENSPEERDQVDPVNYLGAFWQLEQIAPRDDFGELIEKVAASLERDSNSPLQTGGEDHAEPVLEGPPA